MFKIAFPIFVFLLFGAIHYFAYRFFSHRIFTRVKSRRLLGGLLVLNFLAVLGYLFARYWVNIPQWIYFLLSLTVGVTLVLFCTIIVIGILELMLLFPMSSHRKHLISRGIYAFGGIFFITYLSLAIFYGNIDPKIKRISLEIPHLKSPMRIVQLSDIHIGGLVEETYMKRLVERVNALDPDVILLTGDITDASVERIEPAMNYLGDLQAKFGTYFVTGNHEFFHGAERTMNKLRSLGIRVLENEHVKVNDTINIAGVHDVFGRRAGYFAPDILKAVANIDQEIPTILLSHQPRFIREILDQPIDLMLSGHTHGGQIAPFNFLVKLDQPYIQGLYTISPRLKLYVSPGTGFWGPPMRFLAEAEITLFELHGTRNQ